MKKVKKRVSKNPPPNWPSEQQWEKLEKKISKGLISQAMPENPSPVEKTKHELCAHFVRYFNSKKISQKEFAKTLGVTESRISEILHYHYGRFTIDKLLLLLSKIKPEVKVHIA